MIVQSPVANPASSKNNVPSLFSKSIDDKFNPNPPQRGVNTISRSVDKVLPKQA